MRPEGWKPFGGGGGTALHPAALVILAAGILLIWALPRRHMLKPFLALAILIPQAQQVVIMGLHMMPVRMLIFAAWIRIAPRLWRRSRFVAGGWQAIDAVFVLWVTWGALAYALAWGDLGALVPKLGFMYNAFGVYFLFRHVIRDQADVDGTVRTLAVICAMLAVLMTIEQTAGRNLLAIFGTPVLAEVRGGLIRSQASFAHPIVAGSFGALLLPLFLSRSWSGVSRCYGLLGAGAAALMIITSSSSTPVAAALAGVAALCMWPAREHMRALRWSALAALVILHTAMEAPVWALLGRIRFIGRSTSWHRFELVNQCIGRIGEWWLVGTTNNDAWGLDMWDTANWYVSCAVSGGLLSLILFVAVIALSFRTVGLARRVNRGSVADVRLIWGLGAGLFAGVIAFLGVELFDQSVVVWYALLALIGATLSWSSRCRRAQRTFQFAAAEHNMMHAGLSRISV